MSSGGRSRPVCRSGSSRPTIVENKPGGGGTIAYSFVAKSPPDGYTLMIAPASFTIGPHLTRNPVYNPVTDFAAIDLLADVPFVMVVPASLPVHSVQEFVDLAKKSPGKLTFASVGPGTPQHLAGELFKLNAKVDLVHVPFRGATAVLPDLVAGRIDMFIGALNSLLPLIQEGKLRALAATRPERIPTLPEVPTMAEAGLPGVQVGSVVGLVARGRDAAEDHRNAQQCDQRHDEGPRLSPAHDRDRRRRGRQHAGRLCEIPQGRL